MTDDWKPPEGGALDDTDWSKHLLARAVDRAANDDRLHGYAVLSDVAAHYRFSDLVFLGIVGELPDERSSALFHVAVCACATVWIGDAPAHVAALARVSGTPIAAALAAGMVAVADEVAALVRDHADFLAWLDVPTSPLPAAFATAADPWVATLRAAVADRDVATLRPELTRLAATIAVFHAAGIRTADRLQAAMIMARSSGLSAEALLTGPEHLPLYPVKVPEFRYVEG